ncbi:hypothetical protein [Ferrimonas balearica]|uniref:hypothetical protein n=1 Tax=Ferrimonas balearica TaxID=44012 RepID=UPI001C99E985|nr:hypothetical protein [Ferrimonas balearica]MBY5993732.1 hypothetical protein [Ferrimonas balearica]
MAWLLISLLLCLILLVGMVDIWSVAMGEWVIWLPLSLVVIGAGIGFGRWLSRRILSRDKGS